MTGNEYQKLAMRTAGGDDAEYLLENGVMGLNGEAGECIDIVKKWHFQGHPLDSKKLKDELGDVLWYVAITADGIGVPFEDIMQHNIASSASATRTASMPSVAFTVRANAKGLGLRGGNICSHGAWRIHG